jgi:hypothetical protein
MRNGFKVPGSKHNQVLSYQMHVASDVGTLSAIVYPRSPTRRLSFDTLVGTATHAALHYKLADAWPRVVFVAAHFLRADLTHFGSFWETMKHGVVDGLRGTLTSLKGDYAVDVEATPSTSHLKLSGQFYAISGLPM